MKNLLNATLPALALLALGGCASTGALTTSTENDGVYYSTKDHTTAVGSSGGVYSGNGTAASGTIPAKALDDTTPATATTEDANPDYQGGTTAQTAPGSDYYNDSYSSYNGSGFGQPYTGPGVSSYNYSPSANYAVSPSYYGSPYGYASAFGYGYSPFSYGMGGFGYPYGGFYNPFYSPFGFGSGLSIGFGYGFGGFGGFGSPYGFGYSPFGYGYPYGYSSFYGQGYGYGGDYVARPVIYTRGAGVSSPGAGAVLYGSRTNRGGAVMAPNAAGNPNTVNVGGRGGSYTGNAVALPSGASSPVAGPVGRGGRAVSFGGATGQPTYSNPSTQAATAAPQATTPNRRGFFGGFFGNGNSTNAAGQPARVGQPANAGSYGSRQRGYSQPSYNNNQMQRSYSQPQRTYSQPSYSQPSRSFGGGSFGGGGGGGSFGGGGGGGRGRR